MEGCPHNFGVAPTVSVGAFHPLLWAYPPQAPYKSTTWNVNHSPHLLPSLPPLPCNYRWSPPRVAAYTFPLGVYPTERVARWPCPSPHLVIWAHRVRESNAHFVSPSEQIVGLRQSKRYWKRCSITLLFDKGVFLCLSEFAGRLR